MVSEKMSSPHVTNFVSAALVLWRATESPTPRCMTEEEFKETVMPLRQPMYGCAASILGNRDDALDALQDALTGLWEHRPNLRKAEDIKAYCLAAVRNSALKVLSKRRSEGTGLQVDELFTLAVADNPDAEEDLEIARQGIASLSESQRKVLLLRSLSGLSHDEISRSVGTSTANVRQILSRARKALQNYIDNYEKKR